MSSSKSKSKFPKAKTIVSTIGSIAAATMVVRSVARDYLPREFRGYLYTRLCNFINTFSTHLTMVIYESDGFQDNELYNAIQIYISEKLSSDIHRMRITKNPNHKKIAVAVEINEEFTDVYNGVKFYWSAVAKKTPCRSYHSTDDDGMSYKSRSDLRSMELKFHRDQREFVLNDYLPLILEHAEIKEREQKTKKLFTLNSSYSRKKWTSVNLDHPANFDTLAMDSDVKEKVIKDLDRFVERREYYLKVGKAWKRGYLLYGPPGTGKSSLIAAIANYMNFDIYDLELADVKSNSDLRSLLLATTNRSILVVEDIDCSVELHDRAVAEGERAEARKKRRHYYPGEKVVKTVTLSGFLNFIDGLWSSCGVERIIIFTTNQKDKLDPALLRPGRMDVHIHMSYCTPCGFRLLATNYLGISQHDLFNPIDDLMLQINVTPAEVAEQLLKDDDPDIVLDGLIEFFHVKRKENEEAEARAKKMKEEKEFAAKEKELAAKEKEQKAENEID